MYTSTTGTELQRIATHDRGEHNLACAGPDTHRTVHGGQVTGDPPGENVYWCAPNGPATGHLMSAVDTGAVALVSFAPKETFTNVRRVCFSINMNNLGEGKWANLFVVPAADVAARGNFLSYNAGVNNDLDAGSVQMPPGGFNFTFFRGTGHAFRGTTGNPVRIGSDMWGADDSNFDPSPAPRYPVCVEDLEDGRVRFTIHRINPNFPSVYTYAGSIPNGDVRVIWQDGSYNPDKHEGTGHLTWHWDDFVITEG